MTKDVFLRDLDLVLLDCNLVQVHIHDPIHELLCTAVTKIDNIFSAIFVLTTKNKIHDVGKSLLASSNS